MLKNGIAGILGLVLLKGTSEAQNVEEVRTREYLEGIPEWDEEAALCEMADVGKTSRVEYLFGGGYDRKDFLDSMEDQIGNTFVYTPRHGMHDDRAFDLILVKIGDRNISERDRLHMEKA